MVSFSSSSCTFCMLPERPGLKLPPPPKGLLPPGKVDSAIVVGCRWWCAKGWRWDVAGVEFWMLQGKCGRIEVV